MKKTKIPPALLQIGHCGPLWLLQKRKKFIFIPYWSTIYSTPFLSEIETKLTMIRSTNA